MIFMVIFGRAAAKNNHKKMKNTRSYAVGGQVWYN